MTPRLSWLWRQTPVRDRVLLVGISPRQWPALLRLRHQLSEGAYALRTMPPEVSRRAQFVRYLVATGRIGDG